MLIHELGHIAACRKFGIKHGEIGFGFYLFFPVLYADVTNIWKLNKHRRIITNLGGIFLELVYASLLGCLFLWLDDVVYLYASISIFIKCLLELNPFIRYDGYWVLSDLTNTPNLLPKSRALFKKAWHQKNLKNFELKHHLVLMYGMANWLLIFGYLVWMIDRLKLDILYFPGEVYHAIKQLGKLDTSYFIDLFSFQNLFLLGFYLLILKLIIFSIKILYIKSKKSH